MQDRLNTYFATNGVSTDQCMRVWFTQILKTRQTGERLLYRLEADPHLIVDCLQAVRHVLVLIILDLFNFEFLFSSLDLLVQHFLGLSQLFGFLL